MKKSTVYLLLLLNLLLSFPISFMGNVNANTLKDPDTFFWLVIVCMVIVLLFFGLVGWIVYMVLKKRNNPDATKYAMFTFTGLMVAGMIGSAPEFNTKFKQRRQMLAEGEFRKGFEEGCRENMAEGIKEMAGNGYKFSENSVDQFCTCLMVNIEMDRELKDAMMDDSRPMDEIQRDPRYIKLATDCAKDLWNEQDTVSQ